MRSVVAGLAFGCAALMNAGVANAQDNPAMNCVYDMLTADTDYEIVAEAFIYDDVTEAQIQQAVLFVGDAKKACAAKFTYSPGQLETAGELGIYAAAIDYLSEELLFEGASEDAVNGISAIYQTLTDEDVDMFFDLDWRSNAAFFGKLKTRVTEAGIPDDDLSVDLSMAILETAAMMEEGRWLFTLDDAAAEATSN